jgi:N6-L-threonylcarbamoyladenine synthase
MKNITSLILGLESSCDDTAAAILRYTKDDSLGGIEILSSIVLDQNSLHQDFRGVVPEIAARAHSERLDYCTKKALKEASTDIENISLISVSSGPGLIGGLLSGIMFAKGLAKGLDCPVLGINHLAAHCLSVKMIHSIDFPYLTLLASGGHCQFLIVEGFDKFLRLGGTIDDAPGECFDKVAASLGLGYPGGPEIEKHSLKGNKNRFPFPRPMMDKLDSNMSFSGLKTAVKRKIDEIIRVQGGLYPKDINDICASFQNSIVEIFRKKSEFAMNEFNNYYGSEGNNYALVGGVAANKEIRKTLERVASNNKFEFFSVPQKFCTDNAAMIAYLGSQKFATGNYSKEDLTPKPRWPLDISAKPMLGFGKRGVKV